MGGDALIYLVTDPFCKFLLTPPRGGRRGLTPHRENRLYFYSRPRVGGDRAEGMTEVPGVVVFLLTPPRGGRLAELTKSETESTFLLTPPRGGRRAPH